MQKVWARRGVLADGQGQDQVRLSACAAKKNSARTSSFFAPFLRAFLCQIFQIYLPQKEIKKAPFAVQQGASFFISIKEKRICI